MKNLSIIFIFFGILIANSYANTAPELSKSFYLVVKNKPIRLGKAKDEILKDLGKPQQKNSMSGKQSATWLFEDGLTFIAVFDKTNQYLSEATISNSSKTKDSYAVIYGDKKYLNTMNIDQLETTYHETYRCLSFYEQDGLGWLDFSVQDISKPNYYATFSALNLSNYALTTLEGKITSKVVSVDSITLSREKQTHSTNIYCKQWFE